MAANLNSFVSITISLTDLTTLPPCYELNSAKQIKRLLYFLSRAEKNQLIKILRVNILVVHITHTGYKFYICTLYFSHIIYYFYRHCRCPGRYPRKFLSVLIISQHNSDRMAMHLISEIRPRPPERRRL